jgi:hypothetical protein
MLTVDGDRLPTHFPPIAVRALEDTRAEQRINPVDSRQMIEDARGNQELSTRDRPPPHFDRKKSVSTAFRMSNFLRPKFEIRKLLQLVLRKLAKVRRRDAFAR